jgi:uncharacterized caspase-like protein
MKRLAIIASVVLLCTLPAVAEKRVALLIGNQNYAVKVGLLKNPKKDVDLVARVLQEAGFEITTLYDADFVTLLRAIDKYAAKIGNAEAGSISFFYYSGHGVARPVERVNYIIPVDVTDMSSDDVWYKSVPLDRILNTLNEKAPGAAHFVVFDACRNELHVPSNDKGNEPKSFAPMIGRNGQFVAFSTGPNETASDEGDFGGPYAIALAAELRRPGQDHLAVFQNVRERVYSATQTRRPPQRPIDVGSLLRRVFFSGSGTPTRVDMPERSPADVDKCLAGLDTRDMSAPDAIALYKKCLRQS